MKIFIRLEFSPNVSMFCKQLAKSAFVDPTTNDQNEYNEFIDELIAEFKNGGH